LTKSSARSAASVDGGWKVSGIADAVMFLCKAPWLTGEVLDLNGGAHMKRYPDLMSHVMKLATQ
jgi:3-oxoacyl-[acyl-carrier protein] reductase